MTWKHSLASVLLLVCFFVLVIEITRAFPRLLVVFFAIFVGIMSAMYLWDVPMEEDSDDYA